MLFKPMFKAGCCGLAAQAAPKLPRGLWADRGGVTSVEYALIASLLALAVLIGQTTVSTALQNAFSTVSQSLEQATVPYAPSPDACRQARKERSRIPTARLGARRSDAWNATAAAQGSVNRATYTATDGGDLVRAS